MLESHWRQRALVGGEWVAPTAAESLTVHNPATGSEIGQVAAAGPAEVRAAVDAGKAALAAARDAPAGASERAATLRALGRLVAERAEWITELECADSGKPQAQARKEVDSAARVYEYYAGAADKVHGSTIPIQPGVLNYTTHAPVGVVAAVVPWNFPFLSLSWKLGPALAAGCPVLLKPAPETPLSALALADLLTAAEAPAGWVSVLPGGAAVGEALTATDGVAHISFTGSTATGKRVMASAAESVKRVSLELGGNNASIVFPDAPFEKAVAGATGSGFGNAGQSCSARSRLLVVDDGAGFADRFVGAVVERAEAIVVGDPRAPGTDMGPLISKAHAHAVDASVRKATAQGGRCLTGGAPLDGGGAFYPPTVVADVEPDNTLMADEIFGPVLAVRRCASEDEALAIANDTAYGLAGSVWTQDVDRALRVTDRLEVGMATVNTNGSASRYAYFGPFGGTGQSGLGRELGLEGVELYLETKNVLVEFGTQA